MDEKKTIELGNDKMDILENQKCPMCMKNTLTLLESEKDIPYFGKVFLFSMDCNNKDCNYQYINKEV